MEHVIETKAEIGDLLYTLYNSKIITYTVVGIHINYYIGSKHSAIKSSKDVFYELCDFLGTIALRGNTNNNDIDTVNGNFFTSKEKLLKKIVNQL